MLLRGYTPDNSKRNSYNISNKRSYKNIDKRYSYNPRYEPIRGSDIFCELPPKNEKYIPDYEIRRNYETFYKKKQNEENLENNRIIKNKSYNKINKNKVYDITKEKFEYNPYRTTYNSTFMPIKINENVLVGNNKELGTGVAYNSRKQKIEFLKSNIFCDKDKYNQNSNLKDNFNPRNINHNNWYTNLDWRNNKSELIFYKNNQKEFYDNNSKSNYKCFNKYK